MTPLRDLANGLPAVLGGQILLVACSVFYLIWWTVVFAPDGRTPRPSGDGSIWTRGCRSY